MISLAGCASQLLMSFSVQYKLDLHAVCFSNTEGTQRQLHIYSVSVIYLELPGSAVTILCVSFSQNVIPSFQKESPEQGTQDQSAKHYPTTSAKKLCAIHRTDGPIRKQYDYIMYDLDKTAPVRPLALDLSLSLHDILENEEYI